MSSKTYLYYIDCLTNLHVGSGEANFNVVDKEVEKDPVSTCLPLIHASGVKGALRDYCESLNDPGIDVIKLFGAPNTAEDASNSGALKILNANMLYRTMRAAGSFGSAKVSSYEILKEFVNLTTAFNCFPGYGTINEADFGGNSFLSNKSIRVEGDATGMLEGEKLLSDYFGGDRSVYAVAKSFDGYDLPVIARNNLGENKNLWYEEYVPHGSRFYLIMIAPDDVEPDKIIKDGTIIQLGGNASIGYGFCRFNYVTKGDFRS